MAGKGIEDFVGKLLFTRTAQTAGKHPAGFRSDRQTAGLEDFPRSHHQACARVRRFEARGGSITFSPWEADE